MPQPLPRLRYDIEFLPSPVAKRPGLMLRDPFSYSDSTLIIPPPLVQALRCFDGEQTDLDLRQLLTQSTGELQVGELMEHLISTLDNGGFLLTPRFDELRDKSHRQFAESPARLASHAGAAYPDDESELRELLTDYLSTPEQAPADAASLVGIAAPHISPEGGWETYREAFRALSPQVLELPPDPIRPVAKKSSSFWAPRITASRAVSASHARTSPRLSARRSPQPPGSTGWPSRRPTPC